MMGGELWHEKCLSEIDWLSRNLVLADQYANSVTKHSVKAHQ